MKKSFWFISSIFFIFCLFFLFKNNVQANQGSSYNLYTPETFSKTTETFRNSEYSSIVFIVDFSNSMNETIGSKTKLQMAQDTMAELLPKIPSNIKTGLRIYGYKSGFTYLQGCQASKLTVPIRSNNGQEILQSLYSNNAVGWTPITYSIKQAINNDFAGISGKKHIILLTDGGENCDESPCTFVINLMRERNDVKIDVIAFDVHDVDANNQLRCTALVTSGKFLSAENENDLSKSLFETVGISKDVRGNIKIKE